MNLSEPQRDAMLTLANWSTGDDFVLQAILDDLRSMGLVYWRTPDEVSFTPAGERVYRELARSVNFP
jgi:ribosomal protein S19E (S16A)